MITSIIEHSGYLLSFSNHRTLSVYNVKELATPSLSLPKILSPLGMTMKTPIATFQLSFIQEGQAKLLISQKNNHEVLLIYDNNSLVLLDLKALTVQAPQVKIFTKTRIDSDAHKGHIISAVLLLQSYNSQQKFLISTTEGKMMSFRLTQSKRVQFQSSFSISDIFQGKDKMVQEQEDKLLMPKQNSEPQQYVNALASSQNQIYLGTNTGRLFKIKKDSYQFVSQFVSQFQTKVRKGQFMQKLLKIVLIRNSVIMLYRRSLIEFNMYTHMATNCVSLPFPTLDVATYNSKSTLQSLLIMVGECNSFYSVNFPFQSSPNCDSNQKNIVLRTVNITNRLAKCVIATQSGIVFIGGCDGVIDVLKGQMQVMVLIEINKQNKYSGK